MSKRDEPDIRLLDAEPRLRQLHSALRMTQARLRLQEIASLAPTAVSLGLAATVLLGLVWRVTISRLTLPGLLLTGAGLMGAALLTILFYALLRPRQLMVTARVSDRLLSLDERLSTALEDALKPPASPTPGQVALREAQLDDALLSISKISLKRDMPVKWRRSNLLPLPLLLALLLGIILVPGVGSSDNERAAQAQVVAEQKNIDALKQALEKDPRLAQDPKLQELLKEVQQLSKDLTGDTASRENALAHLSEAESQIQQALDPQAPAQREAIDQLAKQLSASASDKAKQAGDALQSGDPQEAAKALQKAGEEAGKMSPEERKALAESLRQARDRVASLDPEMAHRLNDAADALQSSDSKAAQQALSDLGKQVSSNAEELATQQQVQQALAQIQQSKSNIAQAGQSTPAASNSGGTVVARGTGVTGLGSPVAGASPGTPAASLGSPVTPSGSPVQVGSPVALGSPVSGTPVGAGTPVLAQSTPGKGTPVVAQGQGQGQGQGNSANGGTQSQGQGSGQSQGQGQGQGSGTGLGNSGPPAGGWGTGHQEPVYAPPSSVSAPSTAVAVQGQNNPGGEQSSTTTNTDVNNTGPAQVPYEQVYGQYKEQAGNALGSDYIPQGYKDLVRDYFTDIQPQNGP